MIKLTQTREITPYVWVHPDEESLIECSARAPPSASRR
jgi:hypothetical protein